MRKLFLGLLFLVITSSGCFAELPPPEPKVTAPAATEANPEIPLSNEGALVAWSFGQIKEGTVAKHTFVFKNDTQKTVTIKDVHTSCGCTASEVKNKVLAPGGQTDIDVSFNSKNYSGAVEQFIFVNTDNVDKPVVKYIIRAQVIK